MDKKLRTICLFLTVVIGIASIIGCNGRQGLRPYIRIDDTSFEGHVINDMTEIIVDGAPLMVAVGHLGSWTSTNGLTWNYHDGPTMTQVIKRGNELFAVTADNILVQSSDGQNWEYSLSFALRVNHISRTNTAGGLLAVGRSLNSSDQYWWPTVWTSEDGVTWERQYLGNSYSDVCTGTHNGTLLVVGGKHISFNQPMFWYSEDNGVTWISATGPFTTTYGEVQHIVSGHNDVFYASSSSGSLWKSTDGKTWVVVEDPEVANSSEQFSFHDHCSTGQSNISFVVGSRGEEPATWGYNRSYNTWKSMDASKIFGSEPPITFTGIGNSPNIAPGYVYTGYRMVGETLIGAIWLHRSN